MKSKKTINIFLIMIIMCLLYYKKINAVPNSPSIVSISGYQLMVQKRNPDNTLSSAKAYIMRGIGWSPAGIGDTIGSQFGTWYKTDIPLLRDAHANTIRTWANFPLDATGLAILDDLYNAGIMVIMTVDILGDYSSQVNYFKNHPAILMWLLGNEWNYNQFYTYNGNNNWCISKINEACATIHSLDNNHPVATCYGGLPSTSVLSSCYGPDLWGLNIYNGISFGSLFSDWKSRSSKPMFLSEYGADAYNNNINGVDGDSQEYGVKSLWNEIENNLSANDSTSVCVGGNIFEFNDEWWKSGNPSSHDTGGFNVLVYPDNFANEEYWGIVDINRNPRKIFYTLHKIWPDKDIIFKLEKESPISTGEDKINITTAFLVYNESLKLISPSKITNTLLLNGSSTTFYSSIEVLSDWENGEYFLYFTCMTNGVLLDAYYSLIIDTIPPTTPTLYSVYYDKSYNYIEWSKSSDNYKLKGYKIYRSLNNTEYYLISETNITYYYDKNINREKTYYYKVKAVDYAGNESDFSRELFVRTELNKISLYPNPFNLNNDNYVKLLINLNLDEYVSVYIYDMEGNLIKRIIEDSKPGLGTHIYKWDGKDLYGNKVKNGLYMFYIKLGGNTKILKNFILIN